MAFLKELSVIFVLFVVVCESGPILEASKEHNLRFCEEPSVATKQLFNQIVHQDGKPFRQTITREILFPSIGVNTVRITCIIVNNLDNDGTGGYVRIVRGGVASYFTELELTSQPGGGLNFIIQMYGGGGS